MLPYSPDWNVDDDGVPAVPAAPPVRVESFPALVPACPAVVLVLPAVLLLLLLLLRTKFPLLSVVKLKSGLRSLAFMVAPAKAL